MERTVSRTFPPRAVSSRVNEVCLRRETSDQVVSFHTPFEKQRTTHPVHCEEITMFESRPWQRCPEATLDTRQALPAGSSHETRAQVWGCRTCKRARTSACWLAAACGRWRRKAVLLLATFRVVEWAPPGEKNKQLVVAVFFLGQKSASVRVPVRLSPTRPRDKAPTRTAAALSRFDGAYPVVSASATFTPRRSPYHKEEGSDLSTGHIFSSAAKEGYPWWMTTVAMSMPVFRFFVCIRKRTFEKLATEPRIQ